MIINYSAILKEFESWFDHDVEREDILVRTCKLLKDKIYHYDWVGFYLLDEESEQLILGPYVGKPTEHLTIPVGKGVCGQVAKTKLTKVVQDVRVEDNYISCSLDVQSEIVVPILKNGEFLAEIDIDSHSPAPFTQSDEQLLTTICNKISLLF
jgi:L-methionine (R)-S-oxide reductase